jgi:uncharacterized cupredoxin-like copper-binding protein
LRRANDGTLTAAFAFPHDLGMKNRAGSLVALIGAMLLLAACSGAAPTWTFAPTPSPGPATPVPSAEPSTAPTSAPTTAPSAGASGEPTGAPGSPGASGAATTIPVELTASVQIHQNGQQISTLTVKNGETIHFEVTNSAGFPHNFFIGPADKLATNQTAGLPGVPDFNTGTETFDYTVTDETATLEFACTVPGHYQAGMRGTFTVEP